MSKDLYYKTPEERLAKYRREQNFYQEQRKDLASQKDEMPDGSDDQGYDDWQEGKIWEED